MAPLVLDSCSSFPNAAFCYWLLLKLIVAPTFSGTSICALFLPLAPLHAFGSFLPLHAFCAFFIHAFCAFLFTPFGTSTPLAPYPRLWRLYTPFAPYRGAFRALFTLLASLHAFCALQRRLSRLIHAFWRFYTPFAPYRGAFYTLFTLFGVSTRLLRLIEAPFAPYSRLLRLHAFGAFLTLRVAGVSFWGHSRRVRGHIAPHALIRCCWRR